MFFPSVPPWAQAEIIGGDKNPSLEGTVQFYPMGEGVLVVVLLRGLPEQGSGIFAIHIHQGDACSGTDFSKAESHFNPESRPHPEHAGDLLPVFRCCGGRAYLAFVTDRFAIENVIGRTVIIHGGVDDFRTQPAGNSGDRIGCGVIRRN